MNFKKLLALLLALAMLLCCFAACDSSDKDDDDEDEKVEEKDKDEDEDEDEDKDDDKDKDDEDDEDDDDDKSSKDDEDDEDDDKVVNRPVKDEDSIIGKWVYKPYFMDILEMSGAADQMNLGDFETDAKVYISFEFDDEETVILSVNMTDCIDEFCDDYIEYLKDGGIDDLLENEGATYDELLDELEDEDMTIDEFYELTREQMDTNLSNVDLTTVNSGDYEFDGEILEIEGVEFEVELDGDEMEIIDLSGDEVNAAMELLFMGSVFEKVA